MEYFEQHPQSREHLPPHLLGQNILVAQKMNTQPPPFDSIKTQDSKISAKEDLQAKVEQQRFLNELETVLSTWRPVYSAPKQLIHALNETLGLDIDPAKKDVDFSHMDSLKGKFKGKCG